MAQGNGRKAQIQSKLDPNFLLFDLLRRLSEEMSEEIRVYKCDLERKGDFITRDIFVFFFHPKWSKLRSTDAENGSKNIVVTKFFTKL